MANENDNETPKKISTSERTNAKNLESLHTAIAIITSLGEGYKPTNPLIEKDALLEFEENFEARTQSVLTAATNEQNEVDTQINAFKPVSSRITLIMKSVRAQGLDPLFIEGLQSTVYRLNGVRIGRNTPDEEPQGAEGGTGAAGSASVSRRSYAGILENLQTFSTQLASNPAHNPNEPEYKSPAITAWVGGLNDIHDDALEAKVATRTARAEFKAYVYNDTDGLIPRMKILKNYVGYILDKADPRLKQLNSLKFTKPKK